jgi:drug/metabolite transporter (DMT)-like permease
MDPQTVVFYRFLLAGLVLGFHLRHTRRLPSFRGAGNRTLLLFAAAVLGCTGNHVVYLLGLQYISPSAAQVVIQLAPMFLLLGAVLIFREAFSKSQWIGFAVLLGGLLLFFNQRVEELAGQWSGYATGVILVVISALLWSGFVLAQKQLMTRYHSGSVLWTIYVVGGVLLLPLTSPSQIGQLDWFQLLVLFYCALNTLVSYGCFGEALAHWEASKVGAVVATTPLITVALMSVAARILPDYLEPERLNFASLLGAVAVVIGSILAARGLGANRRSA